VEGITKVGLIVLVSGIGLFVAGLVLDNFQKELVAGISLGLFSILLVIIGVVILAFSAFSKSGFGRNLNIGVA
jgi:uncharacterized membrane protein